MKRALSYIVALLALCCCCSRTESVPLKQMTVIAPGHFHAALTQKTPLPGVGDTVHVFAPEGVELQVKEIRGNIRKNMLILSKLVQRLCIRILRMENTILNTMNKSFHSGYLWQQVRTLMSILS